MASGMEIDQVCVYCHHEAAALSHLGFDLCMGCNAVLTQRKTTQARSKQNVYMYLRVSTKKQDSDVDSGLFIQQRQCMEYCFDNNLRCLGVYQDVHSAWNMRNGSLKGLRQMMEDMGFEIYLPKKCRSKNKLVAKLRQAIASAKELLLLRTNEPEPENHVDYILVANIDRFGRDVKNLLSIKHQLAMFNTKIVSVCQHILTGTDTGDFSFHREALEAELFSRDRSIRIKSVKRAKKALGHYLGGRPPFGHTIEFINGCRTVVSSPVEQEIIQSIRELRDRGLSSDQIATQLNRENKLRRDVAWTGPKITYILGSQMRNMSQKLGAMEL